MSAYHRSICRVIALVCFLQCSVGQPVQFEARADSSPVRVQDEYRVYVGLRVRTPLVWYAPPSKMAEGISSPPEEGRTEVQAVLCGADVLAPDVLLASIACAPSTAEKTTVFLFPKNFDKSLSLNIQEELKNAVSNVTFMKSYNLESGRNLTNVAHIKLNFDLFRKRAITLH